MIQSGSILSVVDNSGASTALCIKVLNNSIKLATIGDELVVSIRSLFNKRSRLHCGEIYSALLIRKKGWLMRIDGTGIQFRLSAIILIQPKTKTLLASRIKGPVTRELRKKKYLRIICIASIIV